jgi:hypothetical protein
MEQWQETLLGVAAAGTTLGIGGIGTWKLWPWIAERIDRRAGNRLAAINAERAAEVEDRNTEVERNTVLIGRLQSMIDELKTEMKADRLSAAASVRACEEREDALRTELGEQKVRIARAVDRIRVLENQVHRIKGWDLPKFDLNDPDGSAVHIPLLPPKEPM